MMSGDGDGDDENGDDGQRMMKGMIETITKDEEWSRR